MGRITTSSIISGYFFFPLIDSLPKCFGVRIGSSGWIGSTVLGTGCVKHRRVGCALWWSTQSQTPETVACTSLLHYARTCVPLQHVMYRAFINRFHEIASQRMIPPHYHDNHRHTTAWLSLPSLDYRFLSRYTPMLLFES